MRVLALFAAAVLMAAPLVTPAYADGIERPRPRPHRVHRAAPPPLMGAPEQAPPPAPVRESNLVTLPASFFVGGGGVGVDLGSGGSYSSTTVIVRGGSASAVAFASASASAGVGVRGGGWGGGHGGGHGGGGCGCH